MTGPSRRLAQEAIKIVQSVRADDARSEFHEDIDEQEMRRAVGYIRQDIALLSAYVLGAHVQLVWIRRGVWFIGVAILIALLVAVSRLN
jgi:hypothetical protein